MALLSYKIKNQSSVSKTFTYFSGSSSPGNPFSIVVSGFGSAVIESYTTPIFVSSGISDNNFLADTNVPPNGKAYLWSNGDKIQYIKISNTPLIGSNISLPLNRSEKIEFSMVGAKDKNDNFLYPNSSNIAQIEKYIIDRANNKGSYNTIVVNTLSIDTSKAVSADTNNANTGFVYLSQQSSIDPDCNPILNNAIEPRPNEWLQDIDYSVNAITPLNFDQLINFTATRAAVPQSNYTQLGLINSKYIGSSTTRAKINEYNPDNDIDPINKILYDDTITDPFLSNIGKGPSLGKIPNVELNNAYIAYFNKIIDPYPLLNNKTAYYVKYLIDDQGNILDPNLSNINYSIFTETFNLNDYDSNPTRTNISIQNIEESKELSKLNEGLASLHEIGKYPVPILYSQTSSIGHSNEIALSGSRFYSTLGVGIDILNLGININSNQSSAISTTSPLSSQPLINNILKFDSNDITPFQDNERIPTSSLIEGGDKFAILFPNDPSAPNPNTPGENLSTNYRVEGNFTFTTSTIPAKYRGANNIRTDRYIKNYLERTKTSSTKLLTFNLYPYIKPIGSDVLNSYILNTNGFNIKKVTLTIISNPGPNETVHKTLEIISQPSGAYGIQWQVNSNGFSLTPSSLYIEELIITQILERNVFDKKAREDALPLIAGGWYQNFGYSGIPVRYDWNIEFEFNSSVIKQGIGLYLKAEGSMASQDGKQGGILGNGDPLDVFLFFGANGEPNNNWQWARTFTPTYLSGVNTKPILKYKVTSDDIDNAAINTANGPFWRRLPGTTNQLYMSSSILNQAYVSLSPYIQAKLPYESGPSTDFPLTLEPDFIQFDAITDRWSLQEGDEIRFENSEDYVYKIISINGEEAVFPPKNINSENPNDKLRVVVSPPFQYPDKNGKIINNEPKNFDFFVVRRWKKNKNFIILNQQKPYGFPVTQSSSPGIILPEYRIDKFNTNPDLVLKDLIEKRII